MGSDPTEPDEDWDAFVQNDDDEDMTGFGEEDCGRWINGRLTFQCQFAGTEECDWECPIGLPHRQRKAVP